MATGDDIDIALRTALGAANFLESRSGKSGVNALHGVQIDRAADCLIARAIKALFNNPARRIVKADANARIFQTL